MKMTRAQLAVKVGLLVGPSGKDGIAKYLAGAKWLMIRYDGVQDWPNMRLLLNQDGVEISDGEEWLGLCIEEEEE